MLAVLEQTDGESWGVGEAETIVIKPWWFSSSTSLEPLSPEPSPAAQAGIH